MGVAPRILSGWVPSVAEPSPWNQFQRELMFALVEVESDICGGCGGFLSFTTRRDHGLEVTRRQCEHCAQIHQANEAYDKEDERLKGTLEEWEPSARKVSHRPIPLPPEAVEEMRNLGIPETVFEPRSDEEA